MKNNFQAVLLPCKLHKSQNYVFSSILFSKYLETIP